MFKTENLIPEETFQNSQGEIFTISLDKVHLTEEHKYWGYFARVTNSSGLSRTHKIMVKKHYYDNNESSGDQIAKTLGFDEVKRRIELDSPMLWPLDTILAVEGWTVF